MSRRAMAGIWIIGLVLVGAFFCIWYLHPDSGKATLVATCVIGAATAVYVLFTLDIVLANQEIVRTNQELVRSNQAAAQAALDSAGVMQRSLQLSYSPNLLFATVVRKSPIFADGDSAQPVRNSDQERAEAEFAGTGQQMEYVFAVIRNIGQGTATRLRIDLFYTVTESASPNVTFDVHKTADVPELQSKREVALLIYTSRAPTPGDKVALVSGVLSISDLYRDAQALAPVDHSIALAENSVRREPGCVLRLE